MQLPSVPTLDVPKLDIPDVKLPDIPMPSRWTLFWIAIGLSCASCCSSGKSSISSKNAPIELNVKAEEENNNAKAEAERIEWIERAEAKVKSDLQGKYSKFVDEGEEVLLSNGFNKRSGGLIHIGEWQARQLILTNKPKIYYVDMTKEKDGKKAVKGTIEWTDKYTPTASEATNQLNISAMEGTKERVYEFRKQTLEEKGDVDANFATWVSAVNVQKKQK